MISILFAYHHDQSQELKKERFFVFENMYVVFCV